jgi:E3 Ubiquitin ligase
LCAQAAFSMFYSASDGSWFMLVALGGAVGGVALFFQGFRMLRYKRLILNTPFSKIRSASIGLVEVSGMPTGPQTISAAITGDPCYYYRVKAWQWVESGNDHKWEQVLDESLSVPFFLDDSTGKVLINPQGAELDVHRNFTDEVQTSRFGQGSVIPENIRKFVALRGLLSGDKIRLEERIIKPGYPLFVYGTLGENPGQMSWSPTPHTTATRLSFASGLTRSLNFKFSLGESGSDLAMKMIGEMAPRSSGDKSVHIEARNTTGGPIVPPDRVVEELNRIGAPLPVSVLRESSLMAFNAEGLASSSGIAIATQITRDGPGALPAAGAEKQSSARGTPDASSFDLHPRVAIGKGERGDPFTISSQSQREVVQALAWKSMLYIWGSPVFTLACIYFLLVYWGWL